MSLSEPRSRPLVLVVDDDPFVLAMLEAALLRHGLAVETAPCGEAAVTRFRAERADVVLSAVMLPGTDGPATLAALRALDPAVPCVFMSGPSGGYTAEELLSPGAAAVVEKPFRSLARLAGLLREVAGCAAAGRPGGGREARPPRRPDAAGVEVVAAASPAPLPALVGGGRGR
jgi:CheY-like chemotaxis protein